MKPTNYVKYGISGYANETINGKTKRIYKGYFSGVVRDGANRLGLIMSQNPELRKCDELRSAAFIRL